MQMNSRTCRHSKEHWLVKTSMIMTKQMMNQTMNQTNIKVKVTRESKASRARLIHKTHQIQKITLFQFAGTPFTIFAMASRSIA